MIRRRKAVMAAEEDAIRRENKQREWQENGTWLSRAALEAGVHCRGCGLPEPATRSRRSTAIGWGRALFISPRHRYQSRTGQAAP